MDCKDVNGLVLNIVTEGTIYLTLQWEVDMDFKNEYGEVCNKKCL